MFDAVRHLRRDGFRVAAVAVALATAAGCSGGGRGGGVLPATGGGGTATTGATAAPAGPATLSLRIAIPGTASTSSLRRAKYVSPATNSVTIAENGGPVTVVPLGATAPGCATANGVRTCTVSYAVVPGAAQTFVVKLYASSDGSGTPLSAQSVVAAIVAGQNNTISLTLGGVVAALSVALSPQTLPAAQSGTANVIVNATDASGYVIVGPGGFSDANGNALVVTLAEDDMTGATHLGSTSVSGPATVPLTYNGKASSGTVKITATAANLKAASGLLTIGASSGAVSASQATAALTNVNSLYANLPHTSYSSDLQTLANQMVASGAFSSASVTPGGISATLPDGSIALVFADRGQKGYGASSSVARRPNGLVFTPAPSPSAGATATATAVPTTPPSPAPTPAPTLQPAETLSAPNSHDIVFLINETDGSNAFTPSRQVDFGKAFTALGFSQNGYGVDVHDVTLENIIALGSGHPIDFFDMATHGMVALDSSSNTQYYAWLSSTYVTDTANTAYAADIAAKRVGYAITLQYPTQSANLPKYWFTPSFLTSRVTFNPGAIFDNASCFGQSPPIAQAVQTTMQDAGVGDYLGWTKRVDGDDADETDAFIIDRMLGEQSPSQTGLGTYVNQRTPPQRPFDLADIEAALQTEKRGSDPIGNNVTLNYDQSSDPKNATSPDTADGPIATQIETNFGGPSLSQTPPVFYDMPSIQTMYVLEQSPPSLNLIGDFPPAQGTVTITDSAGPHTLPVTSWSQTQIAATIPVTGAGSAGMVQVKSALGVPSNVVPLTQWKGQFFYIENDAIPDMSGKDGSGAGSLSLSFNVDFRSDVHPLEPKIDSSPQPQNFGFDNVEGDSTANLLTYGASFNSADGKTSVSFSTIPSPPPLNAIDPPLQPGAFEIHNLAGVLGQYQQCNNGIPGIGTGPGPSNVFCPALGYFLGPYIICTTNQGTCTPDDYDPIGVFGIPNLDDGGVLALTLNPDYSITVAPGFNTFLGAQFGTSDETDRDGSASVSGSIGKPLYPPSATTPAGIIRRISTGVLPGTARKIVKWRDTFLHTDTNVLRDVKPGGH